MIGYCSFVEKGIRWKYSQGAIVPLSPPFLLNGRCIDGQGVLESSKKAHLVRWESEFDKLDDGVWWHVIKDKAETIEELPKKTRYMVRKASSHYVARPVSFSEIIREGYEVYESAYERYETHEPMMDYREFCESIESISSTSEFWGVYENDSQKMVGFSENYVEHNTCFYVTMWVKPEALKGFASYLLFHEMEGHYLVERGFSYISDGARSLSHNTNIHDFLMRKFNFRRAYSHLNVVYAPWLGAMIKVFYPFRRFMDIVPFKPFKKASVLLKQEEIRRQCDKGAF